MFDARDLLRLPAGRRSQHTSCQPGPLTNLAKLVGPRGNVLAFEPQRAMFYLLCANLALNEQFHVRAYRVAVGDRVGGTRVPLIDHRQDANFGGVALAAYQTALASVACCNSRQRPKCRSSADSAMCAAAAISTTSRMPK